MIQNGQAGIDDKWQRERRDLFLVPHLYERRYPGRYELFDGNMEMQERGIDTRVLTAIGDPITFDEKIVRWPGYWYPDLCIETHSCTKKGREKLGWSFYCEADFILYCRMDAAEQEMRVHQIYWPALQQWFVQNFEKLKTFGPLETINGTSGRKMPFAMLNPDWYWPMTIYRDGRVIERGFPR